MTEQMTMMRMVILMMTVITVMTWCMVVIWLHGQVSRRELI